MKSHSDRKKPGTKIGSKHAKRASAEKTRVNYIDFKCKICEKTFYTSSTTIKGKNWQGCCSPECRREQRFRNFPSAKKCITCKKIFDKSEFFRADRSTPQNQCRICRKSINKACPSRLKEIRVAHSYGMTREEYLDMLDSQNHSCAICGDYLPLKGGRKSGPAVDHCHKTGYVRGILCPPCNRGIGQLRDSVDILEKAVAYLKKDREKNFIAKKHKPESHVVNG